MTAFPAPLRCHRDAGELRRAFAEFATGVTVVTVGGQSPRGMTANSFTSVSLHPPLVLVCVHHEALMHQSLGGARHFGVSVLSSAQETVARHFADQSRPAGLPQFDAVGWTSGAVTGAPLIDGALAHFECEMWRDYDGGDHTIFVGEVLSWEQRLVESAEDAASAQDALLFFQGRLQSSGRQPRATSP